MMARLGTGLTVAAVLAVVIFAALDAARRDPARPSGTGKSAATTAEGVQDRVTTIEAKGASAELYAARSDCRIVGIHLGSGKGQLVGRGCAFSDPGLDPTATLRARCRNGHVELERHTDDALLRFPGCSPAWTMSGSLLYARDGAVLRHPGRVVLPSSELVRLFDGKTRNGRITIDSLISVGREVIAVAVTSSLAGRAEHELGVFAGRRLVASARLPAPPGRLRVSPRRRFVAAVVEREPVAVVIALKDGGVKRYFGASAIAWAPDESALALAGRRRVSVFPITSRGGPTVMANVVAQDLYWR